MDRLVETRNLTKEFYGRGLLTRKSRAFRAVDRVSFDIVKNSIFGLVGESGCGKTTVSRAILHLDPPTSGEVRYAGTSLEELDTKALRSYRQRMQIVFQDPNSALNPKMRIGSSLEEGLINLGISKNERLQRIDEMLDHGRDFPVPPRSLSSRVLRGTETAHCRSPCFDHAAGVPRSG